MARKIKKDFIFAVGRRRASRARVRLHKGKEQHMVNGQSIGEYFPGVLAARAWSRPFQLTKTEGKYYVTVKVEGGGKQGQLGALVHGIARTFVKADEEKFKLLLRKEGLLTRDSRMKERRKVGTGGKARRKKQSPKR